MLNDVPFHLQRSLQLLSTPLRLGFVDVLCHALPQYCQSLFIATNWILQNIKKALIKLALFSKEEF
jgi:hypothetical protein